MALGLQDLLSLPTWRAFDIDDEGPVLVGYDGSGSIQLVELAPDGAATPLTALAGPCTGRYLPGERTELVADPEHDVRGRLSRTAAPAFLAEHLRAEVVG